MDLTIINEELSMKGFLDLLNMFKGEVAAPFAYKTSFFNVEKQSIFDMQRHYAEAHKNCVDVLAMKGVGVYSNLQKKPFIAFAKSGSYVRSPNLEDAKLDFLLTANHDKKEFDKLFHPTICSSFSENPEKLIITDLEGKTFAYKGPNRPTRTVFYSIMMPNTMPKDNLKGLINLIKKFEATTDNMMPADCQNMTHNHYELFMADVGVIKHASLTEHQLSDDILLSESLNYGLKPITVKNLPRETISIENNYTFPCGSHSLSNPNSN